MKKRVKNKTLASNDGIIETVAEFKELASGQVFKTSTAALYTGLLINKYLNTMSDSLSVRYRKSMDILYVLLTYGGALTPSELGRLTFRSKQTVTQIIDKLEKEGLLKRGAIGTDRRTRIIQVTRKGAELARASLAGLRQFVNSVMPEEMNEEQMRQLDATLHQMRRRLYTLMDPRTGREGSHGRR